MDIKELKKQFPTWEEAKRWLSKHGWGIGSIADTETEWNALDKAESKAEIKKPVVNAKTSAASND